MIGPIEENRIDNFLKFIGLKIKLQCDHPSCKNEFEVSIRAYLKDCIDFRDRIKTIERFFKIKREKIVSKSRYSCSEYCAKMMMR